MDKQYNSAQRLLASFGGLAAMAVALPDLGNLAKAAEGVQTVKRRKVPYGAGLKQHFDRMNWANWLERKEKRAVKKV